MAFLDIKNKVREVTGLDDNAYLWSIINAAAKDIYGSKTDIPYILMEQVFILDNDTKQCTMPHYFGELRGCREFNSGLQIQMHDMAPRYQFDGWQEQWAGANILTMRVKNKSPLQNSTDNVAQLTFTLPQAESVDTVLKIVGGNDNSDRIEETVTILAGSLTATSINAFDGDKLIALSRAVLGTFNVTVTDIDGAVLTVMPNNELAPKFTVMQLSDFDWRFTQTNLYVEMVFKIRWKPFVNDYDEFLFTGDMYDDAIYFKTLEHYYFKKEDMQNQLIAAGMKCQEQLEGIGNNVKAGIRKKLGFKPHPIYRAMEGLETPRWYDYARVNTAGFPFIGSP